MRCGFESQTQSTQGVFVFSLLVFISILLIINTCIYEKKHACMYMYDAFTIKY